MHWVPLWGAGSQHWCRHSWALWPCTGSPRLNSDWGSLDARSLFSWGGSEPTVLGDPMARMCTGRDATGLRSRGLGIWSAWDWLRWWIRGWAPAGRSRSARSSSPCSQLSPCSKDCGLELSGPHLTQFKQLACVLKNEKVVSRCGDLLDL